MRSHSILRAAATVCALVGAVSPALAAGDPPIGSRLGNRLEAGRPGSLDRAVRNAHDLARCTVFKRSGTVMRWLTTLDPREFDSAGREIAKPVECETRESIDTNLDMTVVLNSVGGQRGTYAEAALRKEGRLSAKSPPLGALPLGVEYERPWFAMTQRPRQVDEMAVCFSETNPALTWKLLRSTPTTDAEKQAIGEVASQLGPCLIGGTTLKANAYTLRASLAEAYFHRIYGPGAAAVAGR